MTWNILTCLVTCMAALVTCMPNKSKEANITAKSIQIYLEEYSSVAPVALLRCSHSDWIHVLSELYRLGTSDEKKSTNKLLCSSDSNLKVDCIKGGSPFLNGVRTCNETVLSNNDTTRLLKQNSTSSNETSVTVSYECINETSILDLCQTYSLEIDDDVYLASPSLTNSAGSTQTCRCQLTSDKDMKMSVLYAKSPKDWGYTCHNCEYTFHSTIINIDKDVKKNLTIELNDTGTSGENILWIRIVGKKTISLNCNENESDSEEDESKVRTTLTPSHPSSTRLLTTDSVLTTPTDGSSDTPTWYVPNTTATVKEDSTFTSSSRSTVASRTSASKGNGKVAAYVYVVPAVCGVALILLCVAVFIVVRRRGRWRKETEQDRLSEDTQCTDIHPGRRSSYELHGTLTSSTSSHPTLDRNDGGLQKGATAHGATRKPNDSFTGSHSLRRAAFEGHHHSDEFSSGDSNPEAKRQSDPYYSEIKEIEEGLSFSHSFAPEGLDRGQSARRVAVSSGRPTSREPDYETVDIDSEDDSGSAPLKLKSDSLTGESSLVEAAHSDETTKSTTRPLDSTTGPNSDQENETFYMVDNVVYESAEKASPRPLKPDARYDSTDCRYSEHEPANSTYSQPLEPGVTANAMDDKDDDDSLFMVKNEVYESADTMESPTVNGHSKDAVGSEDDDECLMINNVMYESAGSQV